MADLHASTELTVTTGAICGSKKMQAYALGLMAILAMALALGRPAYAQSQSETCKRLAEQQGYVVSDYQNAMSLRQTYNDGNFTYGERKQMQDRVDSAIRAAKALDAETIAAHCLDRPSNITDEDVANFKASHPSLYAPPPFDFNGALATLQVTVNQGNQFASFAVTQYTQGRKAEACAASKSASAAYAKAKIDARDILGRKPYVRYINITKIDANAKQAAADETEFYCTP
jgi:hypothetical protein